MEERIVVEQKKQLYEAVDRMAKRLTGMADFIFDHPETDGNEVRAAALLTDFLKENGFVVEMGCGGLPTAFRGVYENRPQGVWGKGRIPRIGILCEYDALENLGHGCGHHMQGPSCLGAALAVKEVLKSLPYDLVVYGTPAEETFGGKVNMIKAGCFEDIDVALMMHGAPDTCTDKKCLAMSEYEVVYVGKKAHAAIAPEQGRSAFDALLLAFQGVEFLREHVREDVRMHYTVKELPGPANVVPGRAVGKFILRSFSRDYLDSLQDRFYNIINGAAMMSGVEAQIKVIQSLDNKVPVFALNDLVMKNAAEAGIPDLKPPREKTGSTDFGNVMHKLPGCCLRVQFVPSGTASHSMEYIQAGKTEAAHNCVIYGAKALAGTAWDLIADPALIPQIEEEFARNRKEFG